MNQFVLIGGGLLWDGAAVAHGRRGEGAEALRGWKAPGSAARWGRWAVYVAVVIPVVYAVTR